MTAPRFSLDQGSLVDLLDRLVTTGVAADGDVVIALADVDLIRLNLHLVLSPLGIPSAARHSVMPMTATNLPASAGTKGPNTATGLAGLVLAVVDIVRRLLETQALRRMEAGTLTGEEVERLGTALMSLETQTHELARIIKEL